MPPNIKDDDFFFDDLFDDFWEKRSKELRDAMDQKIRAAETKARKVEERAAEAERKLTIALRIIARIRRDVRLDD